MKQKKLALTLAAAIMLSSFSDFPSLTTAITAAAEEATTGKTDETKGLTAPQNVRVEDGFLKWDEVENAYGYMVCAVDKNGGERQTTYYPTEVELNRFFYEQSMDFGEYEFKVCAFDESNTLTDYSSVVTAPYAPNFETPANLRLSEDGTEILWDEVSGAARYNCRIYQDDEERTLRSNSYITSISFPISWAGESGNYLVCIQAMDRDYNVSEWTEPVPFAYTAPTTTKLEAPKNVRLDESGENIVWDAVEGAVSYRVDINLSVSNGAGSAFGTGIIEYTGNTFLNNWKSYIFPFAQIGTDIGVCAMDDTNLDGEWTWLYVDKSFEMERDESIVLPESYVLDGNALRWEDHIIDGDRYWVRILSYDEAIVYDWNHIDPNVGIYIGNSTFPAGNYVVELYAVSQDNKYNYKTYTYTSEAVHDETVWIPKPYYKFDTLLWDFDRLRHEDTSFFWVRFKKDNIVVKLIKTYGEYFYNTRELELVDGDYTVDVCVYEYTDKLGAWSEPRFIHVKGEFIYDKENEVTGTVETSPEAADIPDGDRITSITINPNLNIRYKDNENMEIDLTLFAIKAKEIYDEEGLKRASEALGETIKGNRHYNLLDLTLIYDGEDFSNSYRGLVQVIIPLPKRHREKTFSCYRLAWVDGKIVKEEIPGEQTEDSYIIYLEHFSEYALVGAGEENDDPGTTTPGASFYKIDLKTDGYGKASADVKNIEEVEAGTDVTLTATPNSGYKFSKWTVVKGDVAIKDNKFTMPESDVEIKAEFTKTSSNSGGSSGGSSSGSRRPGSSSSAAETVTVNGKFGGWDDVISAIDFAANYGVITISGNTNIPAEVISAAAKKNIRLEVKVNETFTWVIDAAKVGETFKYLSIADETITCTNKLIRSGEVCKDFRVTETKLGTGASVRCNVGVSNSGKFANLFKVNGTALEFVGVVKVDAGGNALLPITAAGAYKIVISGETKLVGDLNNSMGINALDAAEMLKKLVMNEVTAEEAAKFDFNGDGRTNALDAAAILKWIVNK